MRLRLKDLLVVEEKSSGTDCQSSRKKTNELLAERKAARETTGRLISKRIIEVEKILFGSAAEVVQIWSMVDKVSTKDWLSMSLLVFECMIYLKYNESRWSLAEVGEANKRHKNTSMAAKAR